jgi:hypothetical protein
MSDIKLEERIGDHLVETKPIEGMDGGIYTTVFFRGKLVHVSEVYSGVEPAKFGHDKTVREVTANSTKYMTELSLTSRNEAAWKKVD